MREKPMMTERERLIRFGCCSPEQADAILEYRVGMTDGKCHQTFYNPGEKIVRDCHKPTGHDGEHGDGPFWNDVPDAVS